MNANVDVDPANNNLRIAAVIVTYNRRDKLQRCIDAVMRQRFRQQCGRFRRNAAGTGSEEFPDVSDDTPDIIVVDNNSTDGTGELFVGDDAAYSDERIRYYNTGLNTGGAGGFCCGLRLAAKLGYEYAWLMDDDCIPAETALEILLEAAEEIGDGFGFLSGKVIWRDGSLCRMNIQRKTLTKNVRDFARPIIKVEMSSFASLLVPIKVVRDVGLPLRKFIIWTDDWEFTRRISRKYPCYLVTGSIVLHDMETNTRADIVTSQGDRIGRFRYLYRNDVYLYRREGLRGFAYEAARLTAHLCRLALSRNTAGEKLRKAIIILGSTAEGLSFHPEPERLPSADD